MTDEHGAMEDFRPCPQCSYDFATAAGERGCAWGECPYVPEELNVFCGSCLFDFFTMEGNPPCPDPMACEHGEDARSHVENVREWTRMRGTEAG